MKSCPTPLIIREMSIRTTMRCPFMPMRRVTTQHKDQIPLWGRMCRPGRVSPADGDVRWGRTLQSSAVASQKKEDDPAVPLQGMQQKDWTAGLRRSICTPTFTGPSFTTAQRWEPPTCPPAGDGMKKTCLCCRVRLGGAWGPGKGHTRGRERRWHRGPRSPDRGLLVACITGVRKQGFRRQAPSSMGMQVLGRLQRREEGARPSRRDRPLRQRPGGHTAVYSGPPAPPHTLSLPVCPHHTGLGLLLSFKKGGSSTSLQRGIKACPPQTLPKHWNEATDTS